MARSPYLPDPAEMQAIARPLAAKPSAIPQRAQPPPPPEYQTSRTNEQKAIYRLTAPTPTRAPETVRKCLTDEFDSHADDDKVGPESSLVFEGLVPAQTPSLFEMTPVPAIPSPSTPPRVPVPEPPKERFSSRKNLICLRGSMPYDIYIYINIFKIYIYNAVLASRKSSGLHFEYMWWASLWFLNGYIAGCCTWCQQRNRQHYTRGGVLVAFKLHISYFLILHVLHDWCMFMFYMLNLWIICLRLSNTAIQPRFLQVALTRFQVLRLRS